MSIEIRTGSLEDAAAVEAVHFASRDAVYRGRIPDWPEYGPERPERVERWGGWLTDPDIVSLVGEVDRDIVGFVTVRASADEGEDPTLVAEMPTLYVRPDRWRRGYGAALCAAALDKARELGYAELTLWVVDLNVEAHGFYTKYGFVEDGATTVDKAASNEMSVTARRYRMALDAPR
jgi:GNAT superfamily N-acetyltransferase